MVRLMLRPTLLLCLVSLSASWLLTTAMAATPASASEASAAAPAAASQAAGAPRLVTWDDLIDVKWAKEVQAEMAVVGRLGFMKDGTESADRALAKLRSKWDEAPIIQTYLGQRIRIAGFVVPLDASRDKSRPFLLVPYFGACIHTPPPPANQIILVTPGPDSKVKGVPQTMDTVWVEGLLEGDRVTTEQGVVGYTLRLESARPYTDGKK